MSYIYKLKQPIFFKDQHVANDSRWYQAYGYDISTCVKPSINHNLFGEVFAFVVTCEQGISAYAYFSTWGAAQGVVAHLRDRF